MQDNDERELVLGNKQLLTIFFAAALLCGVFFAVGYVVGGNSVKSGANTTASTTDSSVASTDGKREEPTAPASDAMASNAAPTDLTSAPADTGSVPSAEPQIRDNPASSTPAPSTQTAPPPAPVAAAPAPVAATYQSTSPKTPAGSSTGVFLSVPETGASYVQVSATSRPSADSLVKILRDGGLPAILSTSSKPDLFEVLVGPYRTPITLKDAKQKLTDDGYGDLRVHKF